MINNITNLYTEINDIYNKKIRTQAEIYERERISTNRTISIIIICLVISLIFFAYFIFMFDKANPKGTTLTIANILVSPIPYFILACVFFLLKTVVKNNFIQKVKKNFYPYLVKALDSKLVYTPGANKNFKQVSSLLKFANIPVLNIFNVLYSFISVNGYKDKRFIEIFDALKLLPHYDVLSTDDVILGSYKDRKVNIVEFELQRYEENNFNNKEGVEKKLETFFKGIVFQTTIDKNFNSNVCVQNVNMPTSNLKYMKKSYSKSLEEGMETFDAIRKIDFKKLSQQQVNIQNEQVENRENSGNKKFKKMQWVELESPEFNKIYKTYAEDQIEARYLLTTSLMERLIDVYKQGMQILMNVEGNKVTLVIRTKKDMFEPNLKKCLNDVTSYYEVLSQLKTILDLITTLKFDQNIGL